MRKISLLTAVLISASFMTACGLKKAATTAMGKIATDGVVVLESEKDVDLARTSTPPLILTLEVIGKGNPKDKRLLTLISRSYGQYAFGFLEEDLLRYKDSDKAAYERSYQRADLFYERGKEYGLSSLWSKKERERVLSLPQDRFEANLRKFGKGRIDSLFWAAFCWGNWINLHRDDPLIFAEIPRVGAMMKRVVELDPSYYFGSAHTFLGAIAASRPQMLGGDPKLAKEEFTAAINMNEGYLMHKVMYAQYYGIQFQDKGAFNSSLQEVTSQDAGKMPEQQLANTLAKRRAEILLAKEKKYFN